jgi:adenylyl-sulfate kinase
MEGFTVWFTGLTASGKTTVAQLVQEELLRRGYKVELLDGDEVRKWLSDGLGFTREDRDRNVMRIGYVCKLLSRNGVVAIAAAISPYRDTRERLKDEIGEFVEVYVKCPLEICEQRDYKNIYKRAREGKIDHVTGISDPYEEPLDPDVLLETHLESPSQCASKVIRTLEEMGYVEHQREGTPAYTEEEAQEVQRRLQDLGYI